MIIFVVVYLLLFTLTILFFKGANLYKSDDEKNYEDHEQMEIIRKDKKWNLMELNIKFFTILI